MDPVARSSRSAIVVALCLLAGTADARSRGRTGISPPPQRMYPASTCAALFGSGEERAQNARARQPLYFVHEELEGITLAHSSPSWTDPTEVELEGVRLIRSGDARAVVRVSSAAALPPGCPAGEYEVGRDDSLGRSTRILAVLKAGLLMERAGRLVYLRAPGTAARWFLAWSAPGMVRLPVGESGDREGGTIYMR
jgi:hypothetical protein